MYGEQWRSISFAFFSHVISKSSMYTTKCRLEELLEAVVLGFDMYWMPDCVLGDSRKANICCGSE